MGARLPCYLTGVVSTAGWEVQVSSRKEEFVRRLSTMGTGTRESIQVLLAGVVYDIRELTIHDRFEEEDMDAVIGFHDQAEALWRDALATDPPLEPAELIARLRRLAAACDSGPLGQFQAKLERGVERAEQFEQARRRD